MSIYQSIFSSFVRSFAHTFVRSFVLLVFFFQLLDTIFSLRSFFFFFFFTVYCSILRKFLFPLFFALNERILFHLNQIYEFKLTLFNEFGWTNEQSCLTYDNNEIMNDFSLIFNQHKNWLMLVYSLKMIDRKTLCWCVRALHSDKIKTTWWTWSSNVMAAPFYVCENKRESYENLLLECAFKTMNNTKQQIKSVFLYISVLS